MLEFVKRKFWTSRLGFTLIELSIVLVIIGFLAGAVVVGNDLIKASEIRAQVSQMEKLNAAVTTFKLNYNGFPGDLKYTDARALGFFVSSWAPSAMAGDGNGILESGIGGCGGVGGTNCFHAEFLMFFRHLSDAKLIEGNYSPDSIISSYGILATAATTVEMVNQYMPPAKIGHSASITVNSYNGTNYFTLAGFKGINVINGYYETVPGNNRTADNVLSAQEAYKIDEKIDDGKPNTGKVLGIDTFQDISNQKNKWVAVSTNANCVTGGTDYTLSNATTGACSLSFKFP